MAHVPASYIKNKPVAHEAEIFACLGVPRLFCGQMVAPPSIGVMSLLEVLDNRFVGGSPDATAVDMIEALYVAQRGREAAPDVQGWFLTVRKSVGNPRAYPDLAAPATWSPWDRLVLAFGDEIADDFQADEMDAFREWLMGPTLAGFGMIPPSCSAGGLYLFGAEALAMVAGVAGAIGMDADRALWDAPLAIAGFAAAGQARASGMKGVSRPKDKADIILQCSLADEREKRGELHPWQIKEPHMYNLDPAQIEARPEIKDEYNAALKAYLKAKRGEGNGQTDD